MEILRTQKLFKEISELREKARQGLLELYQPGVGPYAGQDKYYTIFGRDMAIMALLVMNIFPEMARDVILTLGSYQGAKENPRTGESPGKILHEVRRNGKYISYVAADSTPLFVILIKKYCEQVSEDVLDEMSNGVSVRERLSQAAEWIASNIIGESLFVVPRRKELNFYGQTLEDALMNHIRTDGSLFAPANEDFIAYCSLQGLAYDALVAASQILRRPDLHALAQGIVVATTQHFWDKRRGFFVECIDEDEFLSRLKFEDSGVEFSYALTVASARILNSELLFRLEEEDRQGMVRRMVNKLFSPEFLTKAGLRTRSRKHCDFCGGLADYGGSWSSYPVITYIVAKGLRQHGFMPEALGLESRVIRTIMSAGSCQEFFFVDLAGNVLHQPSTERGGTKVSFLAQFNPEPHQGWTMATILAILRQWSLDGIDIDKHLAPRDEALSLIADANTSAGLLRTVGYLMHGDGIGLTGVIKIAVRAIRDCITK